MTRLQELAKWYADRMTTGRRNDGETFYKFRDELPAAEEDRCRAMAMDAHADMLPDDWRYRLIDEALCALEEADDPDEIQLEADIYTLELTRWLGSRTSRVAYCDEAVSDNGMTEADTITRLRLGQLREKEEVLSLVRAYLENEADDDESDDDAI